MLGGGKLLDGGVPNLLQQFPYQLADQSQMLSTFRGWQCKDAVCKNLIQQVLVQLVHCQEGNRGLQESDGGSMDLSLRSFVSQVEGHDL